MTRHRRARAFMPHNLARHKLGDTSCFEHRHRAVAQTVERNLARFTRLVAAFARCSCVRAVLILGSLMNTCRTYGVP
jgi:hypothetical protein